MEVPISLYLKTRQGEHPNLKVAARAALAFAEVVEEVARSIDPDLIVEVELVSGSEGSLGLNTLNKVKESAGAAKQAVLTGWKKHEKARYLAIFVAAKILDNSVSWTQEKLMDWMASEDAPEEVHTMKQADRRALAAEIAAQVREDQAHDKVQQLYHQISRDERIEAIGVTARPGVAQKLLPRAAFANSGASAVEETDRVTHQRMEVTLVSPVLEFGDRRWKLRGSYGEFGAPIRDKNFLQRAVTGSTNLHLRGGVILDVDVSTQERLIDGVWTIQSRSVDVVHGWREGPVQGELLPPGA